MTFFLGLTILMSTIGLVLRYRCFIKRQSTPYSQQIKRQSNRISIVLSSLYILGFFTVLFGYFNIPKTYFNYLSLYLLMMPLLLIWGSVICGIIFSELILPIPVIHFDNRKQRIFYLSLLNIILLPSIIFIATRSLPTTTKTIKGLLNGPVLTQGYVEAKSSSVSRIGTHYYIDINGKHKLVPDSQWWYSLEKGEKIAYLHNSHADGISAIFQPNQIDLTISGLLLIVINLTLWLFTILFSWNGFIQSINKSKNSTINV